MIRYVYSVIQVTPKLSAGETVNVAVIAGNDQVGDWSLRRVHDTNRARRFCGINAMTAAEEFLARTEERIDALREEDFAQWLGDFVGPATPVSEQLIDELAGWRRGVVRLTTPMPVIADSAEEALDLLVPDLLVETAPRSFARMTKKKLVADMSRSYLRAGLFHEQLLARPQLVVGQYRQFETNADIAVATDRVVQICNAWSFQIADRADLLRSVQAWGWNMRELRDYGGVLEAQQLEVPADVDIEVVVAPDTSSEGQRALENAQLVFEEVQAKVVAWEDRDRVADSALKLVS
ncbi:DUF3037 domain-containing protein [Mycolicibacterium vanbaalenii]|uniref:DUF3037 domain-containing protein n=1 Tax=Mycolicibacterium vanbaalenii (strain DSM 7251 / JCM 13017 / BCRC 16820 / KCTC 9966 / NRRL B-24157 / PYR-1) TaxID=350058 RepID=A1T541_MYCVP|nr:DUF3037 domain-containing protein [Mycolicibacterium vanbaalenii]ABM12291.1 hypothetical protein Mvan_1458 [Mycolicibacterium vanbaalenii PYR-1]MCV7131024.1 DUF3037 domain-containing protein [Mycolicibacterium vanbaalenii PYR-1]